MRIVAWNCSSAFHRKASALLSLSPDVAVVPECGAVDRLLAKAPAAFQPTSHLWVGDNPNKGLGVFSFGEYRLAAGARQDASITYAAPVRIEGPTRFHLLALWAHHGKKSYARATPGPTQLAVRRYRRFLTAAPSIVAGDFNNHVRWDKPGKENNHANTVAALAELGLVSAYHAFHAVADGSEAHATLFWRDRTEDGPRYHIDYCFIPKRARQLLTSVSVGSFRDWIATGLSDHAPLIVDLHPRFAGS